MSDIEKGYEEWAARPYAKIIIGMAMDGRMRDIDLMEVFKAGAEYERRRVVEIIDKAIENADPMYDDALYGLLNQLGEGNE